MVEAVVSGATGFVGSHLATRLTQEGHKVHALVRPSSDVKKLQKLSPPPQLHVLEGNTPHLATLFKEIQPEVVFHLAAHGGPVHNLEEVDVIVEANLAFGTRLLEASAHCDDCCFINTGSFSEYYEDTEPTPMSLYAATKTAFRDLLHYYVRTGRLRGVTLILFDTYGRGDERGKLLQKLKQAAETGEPLPVSPGEQLLDLVHIDDVTTAYLQAANLLINGEVPPAETYAVATGKRHNLREIVALYERILGKPIPVEWGGRPYREWQIMCPWTGPQLPGWESNISLEEGLRRLEGS